MYFYQPAISDGYYKLDGEEMQHCVKVLRKKIGDQIGVLDGKGGLYSVTISNITNKEVLFHIDHLEEIPSKKFHHHVALSPTKNIDRTEWFVEKACELGVDEISFIFTKNSERKHLKLDRLIKKAISALKQSKSGYITKIHEAIKFDDFLKKTQNTNCAKYLAYVNEGLSYYADILPQHAHILTLIGPEGDFSPEEVKKTIDFRFEQISLGNNVLRTETAGIIACQFVNSVNKY